MSTGLPTGDFYCTRCGRVHFSGCCPTYAPMPSYEPGCQPFNAQAEIRELRNRIAELERRVSALDDPLGRPVSSEDAER